MAKRKYINKRLIEEFTSPQKLPPEVEDEILEAFAKYSIEEDMTTEDLSSYFKDLKIERCFLIGNRRLNEDDLVIEGTNIIDFDKLLITSYQLIKFRDNKALIEEMWKYLTSEISSMEGTSPKSTINYQDLKKMNDDSRIGIGDRLLLDMVAVGTDGKSVDLGMVDLAYTLGKLGELV